MKLQTSIQPRRDGSVLVAGQDGVKYVFVPDEDGEMSCDVGDQATVAALLRTDKFWPVDGADFEAALTLADPGEQEGADAAAGDAEDDGDDDEDDEAALDALPIESMTPPAPARPGRGKAKAK